MSQTTNLQLNKHDNVSTNENPFDIENYLNANWDILDNTINNIETRQETQDEEIGTLHSFSGRRLSLSLDKNNYKLTAVLRNADNEKISESQIDLPLEDLEKEIEILSETIDSELEDGVATGESITVNDSARAKAKLDVGGNTSQEASPNPDYPQEVQVVKGSNTIKVSNKNWFDKDNTHSINAYINTSTMKFALSSTVKTYWIACQPNTTYTIQKILSKQFRVGTSNEIPSVDSSLLQAFQNNDITQYTITTNSQAKYLCINIRNSSSDTLTEKEILDSIQIEKSSTATDYVEHEEQNLTLTLPNGLEMCKIGDYKDGFVKDLDSGKWYKNKAIQKLVLNGSEQWTLRNNDGTNYCYSISSITNYKHATLSNYGFSNFFNVGRAYGFDDALSRGVGLWLYTTTGSNAIYLVTNKATTVNDLKNWLSNNNTTVYYVLETPVLEEITDETLISQLDKLYEVITYYGQTNVTCEGDGLSPIFTLNYKKSNRLRLENIENRLAQIEQ